MTLPAEHGSPSFEDLFKTKVADATALVRETLSGAAAPCITCSFQAEGLVVLHMIRQTRPDIPVLFLDTGYHFADVYRYRDDMAARWHLNLINLLPIQSVAEQEKTFGLLYETAPEQCCAARKVKPLFTALEHYSTWYTGLRREQSKTRETLQHIAEFTLPTGKRLEKISPLVDWTTRDVWTYATANHIPLLPLYDQGYTSIGCEPCTGLPMHGDARSGRWGGRKLECGIHIQPAPQQ